MDKKITLEQLSMLFYDSIIEDVPLRIKIESFSQRFSEKKNYTSTSISSINFTEKKLHNFSKVSDKKGNPSNISKEKHNLIKQCELMKNRIETLKRKEKELHSKIVRKKNKESSIEKIKNEKQKDRDILEKIKKEEEKELQKKKDMIKQEHDNEIIGIKESIEANLKAKKLKYQIILEDRKRAYSQRLIISLTNEEKNKQKCAKLKTDMNKKKKKKSISTEKIKISEEKEKELLEKQLATLQKQEELFLSKLENTKKNLKEIAENGSLIETPNFNISQESKNTTSRNKKRNKSSISKSIDSCIEPKNKTVNNSTKKSSNNAHHLTNSVERSLFRQKQKEFNKEIFELNKIRFSESKKKKQK